MTKIDISPDAVERLADRSARLSFSKDTTSHDQCVAATLRALAAENARLREALRNAADALAEAIGTGLLDHGGFAELLARDVEQARAALAGETP